MAQQTTQGQAVDLNSASEQELARVPGVGETRARKIVEYRKRNGRFQRLDDLRRVEGFSDDLISAMRHSIRV
ncbi:MAG TPA: helix-hairpin-helix domain-containing protein [Polyangiaceae bacterium]|nr:helix-hairpin-helix domain-containing protein [Polyangiaceae bacterium]